MNIDLEKARAVKNRQERRWLSLTGVLAVGIGQTGDGGVAIVISVVRLTDRITKKIPSVINGVPIEVKETGTFRAAE